ncbi:RNA polymerase sigma factor [Parachryseolinea silvisoli]|jgi:RNA polymerase sigma-70 factor (ECF subfamily)|uniref:RNA polymerase sigma factor n=1 Tax=Parachryseolinea silvisoli TaxID=2873601 RepID=UPI002265B23A|nr:sigma-70 family RNA polymerase sigma factor [Parachryseolinea silvisoli]MCD9018237.1 sigma-70 family RNA polymerase sigma factor [Parachryseolinea silvisoli]
MGTGLENAFIQHLQDHRGVVLKVCRIYSDDRDDFDDLFQEIILQLWKSYSSFRGESLVSTWMYRVALNTAITSLRKRKRRPDQHSLQAFHHNQAEVPDDRIDRVYAQELQRAIQALNKFDRAVLMLYLEEKSYGEMAQILDISENYIGVKLTRIRNKLKELLTP